jgi:D-mannonate dehydratase
VTDPGGAARRLHLTRVDAAVAWARGACIPHNDVDAELERWQQSIKADRIRVNRARAKLIKGNENWYPDLDWARTLQALASAHNATAQARERNRKFEQEQRKGMPTEALEAQYAFELRRELQGWTEEQWREALSIGGWHPINIDEILEARRGA